MPGESLSFSITADDRASGKFRDVGRSALDASAKMDVAAASLKLWEDTSARSSKATDNLIKSKLAAAKADATLQKAESFVSGEADKLTRLMSGQSRTFDDTAKKAENAAGGLSSLAGGANLAGAGMGALVAAGVALSPVIATLGVGLGGLALAAVGMGKKSQILAQEIAPLRAEFAGFQKELEPVLLTDFAGAAKLAGTVLRDIEPVAAATGKALGGVFTQLNADFRSPEWTQFFGFMERTAGPDVRLLGKNFIDLANALPPLLESLQPVATDLLNITDATSKLVGVLARADQSLTSNAQHMNTLQHVTALLRTLLFAPGAGLNAALHLLGLASDGASVSLKKTGDTTQALATSAALTISPFDHMAKVADTLTGSSANMAKIAAQEATAFHNEAHELNVLAAQQEHALTPLENYISANITAANDAHNLRVALRASGDAIGYKTQKERDSFAAAQTYITDTVSQGNAALGAHKGINAQITSIQNALPLLESVKGKTAAYKQELDHLKTILDELRAERQIDEQVRVTGRGNFAVVGVGPFAGKVTGASGAYVTAGTTSTADDVVARVSKGELIVPTHMVNAGAVDHLRGSIPGFASGGLVPSYSGSAGGLGPWAVSDRNATVRIFAEATAAATFAAMKAAARAAAAAAASAPGSLGGPTSAGAAQAQAYARSRLAAYGWSSGQMPPLIALWNGESGWNRFARNPTSGAYGIPQALPPGKMGAAANPPTSSAAAQINWGLGYIRSVYGSPGNAYGTWLSRSPHWYDRGGLLPPGLSLAYNGTGRPEMVVPSRGGGGQHVVIEVRGNDTETSQFLVRLLKRHVRVAGGGSVQAAFATSR